MTRKDKLLLPAVAALFLAYLVASAGLVADRQQALVCHSLQIKVRDSAVSRFITPAAVSRILARDAGKITGEYMANLDACHLEQLLNRNSVVRNTEVFSSIDGVLHVDVYQRRPLVRLQTPTRGFYIDETGYIFPLSGVYTSYVPVVTGNIPAGIAPGYKGPLPAREKFLQQLYDFARFLDKHAFWASQIVQVHVKSPSDITLVPREGREAIHLGALDGFEYKLGKLEAFYRNARPAGLKSPYSDIDLRYGNQVICKRKNN
jgi:cell division protein FtsQ